MPLHRAYFVPASRPAEVEGQSKTSTRGICRNANPQLLVLHRACFLPELTFFPVSRQPTISKFQSSMHAISMAFRGPQPTAGHQSQPPTSPGSMGSSSASALASEECTVPITRIARACERCRRRKIRCEGTQPCSSCFHQQESCIYRPGPPRFRTRSRAIQYQRHAENPKTPPNTAMPTEEDGLPRTQLEQWLARLQAGIGVSASETSFQFYGICSWVVRRSWRIGWR